MLLAARVRRSASHCLASFSVALRSPTPPHTQSPCLISAPRWTPPSLWMRSTVSAPRSSSARVRGGATSPHPPDGSNSAHLPPPIALSSLTPPPPTPFPRRVLHVRRRHFPPRSHQLRRRRRRSRDQAHPEHHHPHPDRLLPHGHRCVSADLPRRSFSPRAPFFPRRRSSSLPRFPSSSPPPRPVTEADMAIAMASVGGAGFLHYNMTLEDQLANLKAVKAHRLGCPPRGGAGPLSLAPSPPGAGSHRRRHGREDRRQFLGCVPRGHDFSAAAAVGSAERRIARRRRAAVEALEAKLSSQEGGSPS